MRWAHFSNGLSSRPPITTPCCWSATLFFPLAYSFDSRISYFKSWPALFKATLPVAGIFILWDVIFTWREVWGFNERYLTGINLLGLPWEEWAFFIIIPFSCLFIYEALGYFFPRFTLGPLERPLTWLLAFTFLAVGLFNWDKMYTSTTFLLAGFFSLYHAVFVHGASWRSRFYLAYLVSWIPFLLVNGALTGAFTRQPVVVYNPAEFLGIRLGTIPLEDAFYSYLLLFSIATLYERFKKPR
ncbi:MAG: hypothetical protein KatS3mg029_0471 [Saprospiraceae bacterium]|nr:MAG: hypothetical protein KatS3mg029_0471 [Saprospiraceae bacterium]